MNPTILIVLTAVLIVARLVRLAPLLKGREGSRHPLVLFLGSMLSLMALFSILRFVPDEATGTWPLFFHVGFICLWLLLRVEPGTESATAGPEAPGR